MNTFIPLSRRNIAVVVSALMLLLGVLAVSTNATTATAASTEPSSIASAVERPTTNKTKKATIVLVHGAFADASGWEDTAVELRKKGYTVHAWANPLRNIPSDGGNLSAYLTTIKGPVILVGHSYGGAVITQASTGNANVTALVYVAAFAPTADETLAAASELGGGHSTVTDNILVSPYVGAPEGDGDAVIRPDKFHQLFAQDLPEKVTNVLAWAQRPAALSSFIVPASEPGWKTIPSYYLIAENDRIIPPAAQRVMAKRAGSTTTSMKSSHALLMSHPDAVVAAVLRADRRH